MRYVYMAFIMGYLMALTGCSSTKFAKLRTADEVVDNYDNASYKSDGLFLTKHGAVVDIKFEEVKDQKTRLENEIKLANEKIERQHQALEWLERDNIQMRTRLGLSEESNAPMGYSPVRSSNLLEENKRLSSELLNRAMTEMAGR